MTARGEMRDSLLCKALEVFPLSPAGGIRWLPWQWPTPTVPPEAPLAPESRCPPRSLTNAKICHKDPDLLSATAIDRLVWVTLDRRQKLRPENGPSATVSHAYARNGIGKTTP